MVSWFLGESTTIMTVSVFFFTGSKIYAEPIILKEYFFEKKRGTRADNFRRFKHDLLYFTKHLL